MASHFLRKFAFGFLALFLSTQSWALPSSVKKFEVNGYSVYLINTHTGNGAALTANVQAGSWNDEPVHFAGRAHLWEHVIHGGSEKYPGQKTLWDKLSSMGAEYNAYTSNTRIFYHYYLHPDALPEAASLLGAMLSKPEWNKETFEKEKQTVKNEAKEYEGRDDVVLQNSVFINLLPHNHPLAMYDVGTQDQLNAMTLNDLKELYYSNYTPQSVQIIIAGNFDRLPDGKAPLEETSVLKLVKDNFFPPTTQNDPDNYKLPSSSLPLKDKIYPPIVSPLENLANNFIELGTINKQKTIQFMFQASSDVQKHPAVLEMLLDFLNLKNKGSLNDVLNKKGWATETTFSSYELNNLSLIEFTGNLTEEGAKNRHEILNLLYANFDYIKEHGIQPDILEYLKLRNIQSYQQEVAKADDAAEIFAKRLSVPGVEPLRAFDFRETYSGITEEVLKTTVDEAFEGEVIGGYIGSDVTSKDHTAIFDRPQVQMRLAYGKNVPAGVSKVDLATDIARNVILPKIKIDFSTASIAGPDQEAREIKQTREGTRLVFQESHQTPSGGVRAQFKTPRLSNRSSVALIMYLTAFEEHYKSELGYLESLGIQISLDSKYNNINASVSGNSAAVVTATKWLFSHLKEYVPSHDEVELVRAEIKNELEASKQDFTARIALEAAKPLINQQSFSFAEKSQALSSLTAEEIVKVSRLKLNRSDVTLAVVGDYTQDKAESLLTYLSDLFPNRLTPAQRTQVSQLDNTIKGQLNYWERATSTKSEHAYGIARVYNGPPALSREGAALAILTDSLSSAVFQLNRIEKELGYVHSFKPILTESGLKFAFIGQTEGKEKFPLIQAGWAQLIDNIKNKNLSKDGFESEKIGYLRAHNLIPKDIGARVDQIFSDYTLKGDPNATRNLSEMVATLQPNEIYEAGEKYLSTPNYLNVVSSSQRPDGCRPLVASLRAARRALK